MLQAAKYLVHTFLILGFAGILNKGTKWLAFALIFSIGSLSAQVVKEFKVSISSQMNMQMIGSSNLTFEIPANSDKRLIEKEAAVKIKVQTNRNWVLQVKPQAESLFSLTNKSIIPSTNLRIRANGGSFMNLQSDDINLIKGNKGSYQSSGNEISIDYELPYDQEQSTGNYNVTLVYTLAAI